MRQKRAGPAKAVVLVVNDSLYELREWVGLREI
jgi:hypothetical protein